MYGIFFTMLPNFVLVKGKQNKDLSFNNTVRRQIDILPVMYHNAVIYCLIHSGNTVIPQIHWAFVHSKSSKCTHLYTQLLL